MGGTAADEDGDDEADDDGTVAFESPFIVGAEDAPGEVPPVAVPVTGPPLEPGAGGVLAGWLSCAASAICATPATAANPAATA